MKVVRYIVPHPYPISHFPPLLNPKYSQIPYSFLLINTSLYIYILYILLNVMRGAPYISHHSDIQRRGIYTPAPQPRKLARFPCPPHKIPEDPKNGLLEHSRRPKPPSPSIPSRQHGLVVVVTVSACCGRVATNSSRPSRSSFSVAVPVSVTFGFFHTHHKHGILRAASSSPNASKANGLRVAHGHASEVTKARNKARDFLQLSQEASTVVD